jgi:S-adenosylmethionine:tRNA ribosyltransferase-isomerase
VNVEDYVFDLPERLIASHPAEKRDQSRLFVHFQSQDAPGLHRRFADIVEYLQEGDLLVVNNSRVIPARIYARRPSGGRVEILLLNPEGDGANQWRAMVRPARKIRTGDRLEAGDGRLVVEVTAEHDGGERSVRFHCEGDFRQVLEEVGRMPLPPYIMKRRKDEMQATEEELYSSDDTERYQTVYAQHDGSVAAPTAGLHFTDELLDQLRAKGIETTTVTLHVGAGTFQGMDEGGRVEDHVMHFEEYEVSEETAALINKAKAAGRRVIAVGTTSVRTLESAFDRETGLVRSGRRETNLMISPGCKFGVVDGMVTNFHLPRSTLLLLVSAYLGRERLLKAYEEAIAEGYRFFSYGDAMLLLP